MRLFNPVTRTYKVPFRTYLLVMVVIAMTGGISRAQQSPSQLDDANARIAQLEYEVRTLKALQQNQTTAPPQTPDPAAVTAPSKSALDEAMIRSIIDKWSKEKTEAEAERIKAEAEKARQNGFVVGDDLGLHATWDGGGFRFKTNDEAFSMHLGGRLMTDEVWWTQSPSLLKSAVQPPGSPLASITGVGPGLGDLVDGFFVRRARFVADGTIYQTTEFKVEFDFENYNSISFDESYVGAKDLPVIDTVRFGQEHVPFGLEAYTSSRYLPMLERSPLFDAFYQEFAPGIFTNTTFLDQRVTTQHMFSKIDNFSQFNGASFGDGKYAYSGRVSFLPVYENDGRYLLHLAFDYQIRNGSAPLDFNGGTTVTNDNTDVIRFRARPSLRDAVGLQGNTARVIDTGNLNADDVQGVNAELLVYLGPFWLQSETCLAHVDNAVLPLTGNGNVRGDLNYYGSYVQVGYFLTGDNRGYDKRFGKYDRVKPLENFFLVKDENGHCQWGLGAWELVYRYAYVNLNSNGLAGGIYSEHTVGVNWYWNPNVKFQANYINGQRSVPPGAESGNVQGFALRAALEF